MRKLFFVLTVLMLGSLPAGALPAGALPAGSPTLLITEVYYTSTGDDALEEWIEIANLTAEPIEIDAYKLGDEETAGQREGMLRFPAGAVIEANTAIVVAQTAVAFQTSYGFEPTYEMQDSAPDVPDMRPFPLLAGGDMALANGGDEVLLLDAQNGRIDAINYGDSTEFFRPSIAGVPRGNSLARVPADCDTDSAADWQPQPIPNPGEITLEGACTQPQADPDDSTRVRPIGDIQGDGNVAAAINQTVSVRGIVTGIHEDQNARGITFYTLYVQDEPGAEDGNPATSDGVPIFLGQARPEAGIGDRLFATGQVTEFFGLTELDDNRLDVRILSAGHPLPPAVELAFPLEAGRPAAETMQQRYEALEGMRVAIDAAVVVGPTFDGCGFAVARRDVGLSRLIRHTVETDISFITPVLYWSDVDCEGLPALKSGDLVRGLNGPLTYNFDQFKILLQDAAALEIEPAPLPEIPPPPTLADAQFSVATFNLENHFDNFDDTGDDAEPKPSPSEIVRKQAKIAYTISETLGCPTLIGVQEVEKERLLTSLAQELGDACGFTYEVSHLESYDGRGIDNALLTNPERVLVEGFRLRQTCTPIETGIAEFSCPAGQDPLFSRPPFEVNVSVDGVPYTLFVNHLKSKREGEAETAARRLAQADHINALVDELLAGDPAANVIVMGDLNDYADSLPLQRMTTEGRLTNVLRRLPEEEQYSFVFGGVSQLIDGVLVSSSVAEAVDSVSIYHVNADYPDAYGRDLDDYLPYRSSDHDVPLVVVNLDAAPAAVQPSPSPVRPETEAQPGRWPLIAGGAIVVLGLLLLIAIAVRRRS